MSHKSRSGSDAADEFLVTAGEQIDFPRVALRSVLVTFFYWLRDAGELKPAMPYRCLSCGREFATDHGLGIHIGKTHKKGGVVNAPSDASAG